MVDFWADVEEAPRDPILGVTEKFLADQNPEKMNLGVVSPVALAPDPHAPRHPRAATSSRLTPISSRCARSLPPFLTQGRLP